MLQAMLRPKRLHIESTERKHIHLRKLDLNQQKKQRTLTFRVICDIVRINS